MNFSLKKLKDNVLVTPIKDLLKIETERVDRRTLVTLSLPIQEQFTIDDYALMEDNSKDILNRAFKITEDKLFKRVRNFIVKAIVSHGHRGSGVYTHLFGLPYRIVEDTDIEEGAVILLTPQKYSELRDIETEGRNLIFTR